MHSSGPSHCVRADLCSQSWRGVESGQKDSPMRPRAKVPRSSAQSMLSSPSFRRVSGWSTRSGQAGLCFLRWADLVLLSYSLLFAEDFMKASTGNYKDLKLKLDGIVPPGGGFSRNVLLEQLYGSLPRDPQVNLQIYNAEIIPGGYTNWHCHNGAAFFVALQGVFEAHFQEGVLVKAKAGECYSEPIAKFHRGHNPHPELPYLCIGLCFTSPDREHVTNSVERPW
jgi:quercetin dioxygenase-like cupin family protein